MARVDVALEERPEGWKATVRVTEQSGFTTHRVTLNRAHHDRLTGGKASAEECIRLSFEFLLAREPKESILREFDLTVISNYFPEFEEHLRRALPA